MKGNYFFKTRFFPALAPDYLSGFFGGCLPLSADRQVWWAYATILGKSVVFGDTGSLIIERSLESE